MMEPEPVSCPTCGAEVAIPAELVIRRAPCKKCKTVVAQETRADGTQYVIAVDSPEFAKIRARWRWIDAAKKWGVILLLAAGLFFAVAATWLLPEEMIREYDGAFLLLRILAGGPCGLGLWYFLQKEINNEHDAPPRPRRRTVEAP